jgi:hypothetical protein
MTDDRPQAFNALPPEFLALAIALSDYSMTLLGRVCQPMPINPKIRPAMIAAGHAAADAFQTVHRMPIDASARESVDKAMTAVRAAPWYGGIDELITADLAVRSRLWRMRLQPEPQAA